MTVKYECPQLYILTITSTLETNKNRTKAHGTILDFGLQSYHENICYYHQDLHLRPFHSALRHKLLNNPNALLLVNA